MVAVAGREVIKTANLTGSVSRSAGGLFESVRHLVQSLAQTGMDVRVFGVHDRFTAEDAAVWAPVSVNAFEPAWPRKFGYSSRFLQELFAFAPDLTHTHGVWLYPSVATNAYSRKTRCPYVVSAHGMLDPWAMRHSRWRKAAARSLYEGAHLKGARCLRALCQAEALAMRQLGLKNDIVIIPNGVDPPGPSGGSRAQSAIRAEKAKGRKVLLYLGRIHPKKGLINLLKAWKRASAQLVTPGREWALAICGWEQGGHEAELKRVATELGIPWAGAGQDGALRGRTAAASAPAAGDSRSLLFPGPQFNEAKAACYADCDGFILPSFSEGVPMVVLEAWAYGKPVLVTPQCNLPEGYAAGAALRIEPEPESIAQGLAQFWSMTDSERQAMGQRAMALVAEKFVWRQIAAQTRQLYEWMLGGGPKPNGLAYF